MKKQFITLIALFIISIGHGYAQVWVPAATFSYDNVGNRLVRKIETICIGCKPGHQDTTKDNSHPPIPDQISTPIVLEAYPNPTTSDLYINNRTWKQTDKVTVIVFDIQGKIIVKKSFSQAKDFIPFSNFTPGTYMVQYYLNEVPTQVWRIVKM